jgi:transcriptional regulator with XRE-family HTH domain
MEILENEVKVSPAWRPGHQEGAWVRGEGADRAFVAHGPIPSKYILTMRGKTIGMKFESAEEAMRKADEILDGGAVIDISPSPRPLPEGEGEEEQNNRLEDMEMENQQPAEVQAIDEAYKLGKRHGDQTAAMFKAAKLGSEAVGKIKAAEFNIKTNELLKYVTIYQIKQSKEYKQGGMTWEAFCAAIGESQRTVDRILSDLSPLLKGISANLAENLGMPLSKIRFLGQMMSKDSATVAENALVIGDQKIEITPENKDDIEAAIDLLQSEHQMEREKHTKELERIKKRAENAVTEETKNLTVERDALVKELTRLKVFDPEEKDISWSVERMKAIKDVCMEFVVLCSKFIMDERLLDNEHIVLRAEIIKWQDICMESLRDLRQRFNETFIRDFGE